MPKPENNFLAVQPFTTQNEVQKGLAQNKQFPGGPALNTCCFKMTSLSIFCSERGHAQNYFSWLGPNVRQTRIFFVPQASRFETPFFGAGGGAAQKHFSGLKTCLLQAKKACA